MTILYNQLVRPILNIEYASPVWNPWLKKDINEIEKIQKLAFRFCKAETPEPLKARRDRTDLVETYKFLNHNYKTSPDMFFTQPLRDLCGHNKKLHKEYSRTDIRKNFFSYRVVSPWNSLPAEVVNLPTVEAFKKTLRLRPIGEAE